jgi:hypothetical protein
VFLAGCRSAHQANPPRTWPPHLSQSASTAPRS